MRDIMRRMMLSAALALLFAILPAVHAEAVPADVQVTVTSPSRSVAQGATRVTVLRLATVASCASPAMIDSITVRHKGLGARSDIEHVYAQVAGRRISPVAALQRSGTATLRLRGFSIAACGFATIDIVTDFAEDAAVAGQHVFSVASGDIVLHSPGRVTVEQQVQGLFSTAGGNNMHADINVSNLELPVPLTYGERRVLARVRLEASGRREQDVHAVTFTNDGSARGTDLQNLYLQASNGTVLSERMPAMDGRTVTIRLTNPYALKSRDTVLWLLKGDVRASRRRTVRLRIEEPGDIEATLRTR